MAALKVMVLELCCFECLPNVDALGVIYKKVLELCCFECLPNLPIRQLD